MCAGFTAKIFLLIMVPDHVTGNEPGLSQAID